MSYSDKDCITMLRKLKSSFSLTCRKLLKIHDADANIIPFTPNRYQRHLATLLNQGVRLFQIHKSRQLGVSSFVAAYLFFLALFTPRYQVLVVANTHENTLGLWLIYDRFVTHMPKWLRKFVGVTSVQNRIKFAHGGGITFYTANTEAARGKTYQAAHFSEVAHWPNIDRSFAAAMGSLSGSDPLIFLESTANGMNPWHDMWRENPLYEKVFFSWVAEKSLDVHPDHVDKINKMATPAHLQEVVKVHKLTEGQLRWAKSKYEGHCRGNLLTFRQEFPTTPSEAFVASGARVLTRYYSGTPKDAQVGPIVYQTAEEYVSYVMGCDVAGGESGDAGDYSSIVVLNASNPLRPTVAFTYYGKLPPLEFAAVIHDVATRYKTMTVIERNNHGLVVIEELRKKDKDYSLYFERITAKPGAALTMRYGFWTSVKTRPLLFSTLVHAIETGIVDPVDTRLKGELNHLVWKGGKEQADTGHHDDMIIGFGLALQGIASAPNHQHDRLFGKEPRTLPEILAWRHASGGQSLAENSGEFYDDDQDFDSDYGNDDGVLGL